MFKSADAHQNTCSMEPDVTLVTLDFILISSAGAATGTTGESMVGARVGFNIPCKKEEHEEISKGGSWGFAVK